MNALSKLESQGTGVWNPFREMEELTNRLGSLFGRSPMRSQRDEVMTSAQWAPLVDITEDDKEYVVKAELPEVTKDDVKVTVDNGVLTVSGERKFEKEEKHRKYHRVERSYGSFMRSFTLPEDASSEKVHAAFKDGILTVHVAKDEKAKPRSIEVKAA